MSAWSSRARGSRDCSSRLGLVVYDRGVGLVDGGLPGARGGVVAAVVCVGIQTAHEERRRRDPAEAAGVVLGADAVRGRSGRTPGALFVVYFSEYALQSGVWASSLCGNQAYEILCGPGREPPRHHAASGANVASMA